MTNYREILRLQSLGLNKSQIAQSVCCSRTTAIQVLNVAVEKGIRYPLPEDLSDRKLSELLFPNERANAGLRVRSQGTSKKRRYAESLVARIL